jgi:hypothetical protein
MREIIKQWPSSPVKFDGEDTLRNNQVKEIRKDWLNFAYNLDLEKSPE